MNRPSVLAQRHRLVEIGVQTEWRLHLDDLAVAALFNHLEINWCLVVFRKRGVCARRSRGGGADGLQLPVLERGVTRQEHRAAGVGHEHAFAGSFPIGLDDVELDSDDGDALHRRIADGVGNVVSYTIGRLIHPKERSVTGFHGAAEVRPAAEIAPGQRFHRGQVVGREHPP